MKIAIMTSLLAKWNMDINTRQKVYDLMNIFIPIFPLRQERGRG
jgi:hypothetical protein